MRWNEILDFLNLLLPLLIILLSILTGIFFEMIVIKRLKKIAEKTKWEGNEVIIKSLHHIILLWFIILGLYISISLIPLSPKLTHIFNKVIVILAIFSTVLVIARIAGGLTNIYTRKARDVLPKTSLIENLIKWTIFVIGILIILQHLGISITPIITALGIGGLAIALALQDTLSNLFAGIHIIVTRQIRPGDYLKLETGNEGYVEDITWRTTTIRELPGNLLIIPNTKLASLIVTNYHLPEKELSVLCQVGVSYNEDLEKVERVTIEVAREVMREVPGGVPDFDPFIRYHTFSDYSINFTVILRVKEFVDQYLIKHEFLKRLYKRYREEGITIPLPIMRVYLSKGEGEG